jgi:hypothetical protein
MTELPPPILCIDMETKEKVLAQLLPESDEVVTMPAVKFWNNNNRDNSGLWTKEQFTRRFQST